MRILITGGYGCLGKGVAERFIEEKNSVSVIDKLPRGAEGKIKKRHRFYNLSNTDAGCEKVFEANSFEQVIFIPKEQSEQDIAGLVNIFNLSIKTGVKRFILISSTSVYGENRYIDINENSEIKISSPDTCWENMAEYYCNQMNSKSDINIIILRLSRLYGPKLLPEKNTGSIGSCDVSSIIDRAIKKKKINICGSAKDTCDFIFIDDAIEAIYRVSNVASIKGIFNVSSDTETSVEELIGTVSKYLNTKKVVYKKSNSLIDVKREKIDNSKIKKITGFEPAVTITEGIKKTVSWQKDRKKNKRKKKKEKRQVKEYYEISSSFAKKTTGRKTLIIIENILLFLAFAFLENGEILFGINLPDLRLDYLLIYIILVGILWGQVQAYFAMILSAALFIGVNIYIGADPITFFYVPENLINLALYLLVGIITGYSIERKNREIDARNDINLSLRHKYSFLLNVYNQVNLVKNELQSQVIEAEDSFSTIYNIIQEVDSLEIEKVFSGAIEAIERIMKTDKVSIYTLSRGGDKQFMRLKARSPALSGEVPNSIRIDQYPDIEEVIENKRLFVNRQLKPKIPLMVYPVIDGGSVIGIISIHETRFENLTKRYENLFLTVMGLISNALKRAYFFEESLKDKRYLADTRILKPETFEKILKEIKNYKKELGMSYSLLRVMNGGDDYIYLSKQVASGIRENDYIGISKDGRLFILLSNTNNNYAGLVIERLKARGVKSTIAEKGFINE